MTATGIPTPRPTFAPVLKPPSFGEGVCAAEVADAGVVNPVVGLAGWYVVADERPASWGCGTARSYSAFRTARDIEVVAEGGGSGLSSYKDFEKEDARNVEAFRRCYVPAV